MYKVIGETLASDSNVKYSSYGILLINIEEIKFKISDVTTDIDKATALVNLCNSTALSQRHIYEVIEDFLMENYC